MFDVESWKVSLRKTEKIKALVGDRGFNGWQLAFISISSVRKGILTFVELQRV